MSARRVARVLARLRSADTELRLCGVGPGVFSKQDRRRRAVLRFSAADMRALLSDGLIEAGGDGGYRLSAAGAAKVARDEAEPGEEFLAQHRGVVARHVIDADGALRGVRGFDPEGPMRRVAAMRGPGGGPWLTQVELAAAARLRADWDIGRNRPRARFQLDGGAKGRRRARAGQCSRGGDGPSL